MCEYCRPASEKIENVHYVHMPFKMRNAYTGENIELDYNNPVMYLKKYVKNKKRIWSLVCECENKSIETPVTFCPKCGSKLEE